jgi:hypothetical protein
MTSHARHPSADDSHRMFVVSRAMQEFLRAEAAFDFLQACKDYVHDFVSVERQEDIVSRHVPVDTSVIVQVIYRLHDSVGDGADLGNPQASRSIRDGGETASGILEHESFNALDAGKGINENAHVFWQVMVRWQLLEEVDPVAQAFVIRIARGEELFHLEHVLDALVSGRVHTTNVACHLTRRIPREEVVSSDGFHEILSDFEACDIDAVRAMKGPHLDGPGYRAPEQSAVQSIAEQILSVSRTSGMQHDDTAAVHYIGDAVGAYSHRAGGKAWRYSGFYIEDY